MEIKEKLQKALRDVVSDLGLGDVLGGGLEHPDRLEHGDYSSNIAMTIFSKLQIPNPKLQTNSKLKIQKFKTPLELAQELAKILNISYLIPNTCDRIEVAPPGFINFWLSKNELSRQLELALKDGERYASTMLGVNLKGQTLMVEFAHPNTHKEFHIGHLRNIALGESLCRIFTSNGARVIRANYQGDVGLHIAKAIYGFLQISNLKSQISKLQKKSAEDKVKLLAKAYILGTKAYSQDPKARLKIEEINKKLYSGEPGLTKLWKQTRKWSLEYFDTIYKRLGTKFDRLYFESEVAQPGIDIVKKYLDTVFEKSEGAIIFPGGKFGLHNRVFINKVGLATYEAKDLGLASLQFSEFKLDKIIHVVGPEQTEYFKVVFSALEQVLPESKGKEYHLPYGWVRLKTGKMSSRTGEVVAAVWLLDEIKSRLKKTYQMEEGIAGKVAVGSVKYSMLRISTKSELIFDIDQSIRLEGDSGPYLQYTNARCRSVLRKAQSAKRKAQSDWKLESEELALLRTFYKFPETVQAAAYQYAPNLLCNFLYDLASKYNLMYNNLPILEPKEASNVKRQASRNLRLALTVVTAQILKTGLNLLGIQAPERM